MGIPWEHLNAACLVVDDESTMRRTIRNMLEKLGFKNIVTAPNGQQALEFIKSKNFDFVIADINMPQMTGLELFRTVRVDKKNDGLRFIFITAEARRESVARLAEGGADEYIIKPFVLSTLEDRVKKVLERRFNPPPLFTYQQDFRSALELRDLPRAANALEKAQGVAPNSTTLIYYQGELSLAQGDVAKAIESFKRAIEQQPLFVKAYSKLGELYEELGELTTAIKYYEMANNVSPANTERLVGLSKLYRRSGDGDKAMAILQEAASYVREDGATSERLAGEFLLAQGDSEKALKMLLRAHTVNPSDTAITQSLADAYCQVGQFQKAVGLYREIIAFSPNNANIFFSLGKALLEIGDKARGMEAIKKAWELNPFSKEIITTLKGLAAQDKVGL